MNKFIYSLILGVMALTSVGANLTNEKYVTNNVEKAVKTVTSNVIEKITTDTSLTNAAAVAAAKSYTNKEVAAAKTYAEYKAATAENNSKAYADVNIPLTLNEIVTKEGMTYTLSTWTYNYITIDQPGATVKLPAPVTSSTDKRSRILMVILDSSVDYPNIQWDWNGNTVLYHEACPTDERPINGRKVIHFMELKRNVFMLTAAKLLESL